MNTIFAGIYRANISGPQWSSVNLLYTSDERAQYFDIEYSYPRGFPETPRRQNRLEHDKGSEKIDLDDLLVLALKFGPPRTR
jgi:hypothetical protein